MQASIIICTRNRSRSIIPTLESVATAISNAAPSDVEIVVVDNESEDDTFYRISEWKKECDIPINLVSEPRKGLSHARNFGLRSAKGRLLIFTDDDCRMDNDFVRNVLRYDAEDTEPILRGGRVELGDPNDLLIGVKTDRLKKRVCKKFRSSRNENIGTMVLGANMIMSREITEKVGDFDTLFGAGSKLFGGEEVDYIFRTYLAGFSVEYIPDLLVHHFHGRKSETEAIRLRKNYFVSAGALFAKYLFIYPDFCRPFYWDLKKMVKETISGENLFRPDLGLSYKDVILNNIKGFFLYFKSLIGQRLTYSKQSPV